VVGGPSAAAVDCGAREAGEFGALKRQMRQTGVTRVANRR
jgi:hypothetical protein